MSITTSDIKDNMLQKDIKQVVGSLVSELDFYFENKGFKRRKNGFVYTRKISTTVQKIDMVFFSNPSYYQNVLAHIYPQLSVYYPDIQDLAKEILGRRHECSYIRAFSFYRVFIALFNVHHLFL